MDYLDIAMLTVSTVSANHMGLISAAERVLKRPLPILNCVKCLTFWCVLLLTVASGKNMVSALALSFISSYVAIWLELLMGYVDILYDRIYEKIYTADKDESASADGYKSRPCDRLPDMYKE